MAALLASLPLQLVCQLIVAGGSDREDTNIGNHSPLEVEPEILLAGTSATRLASLPLQLVCELIVANNPVVTENGTIADVETTTQSFRQSRLPEGYVKFPEDNAAYKIYENGSTWYEARDRCIAKGARLAVTDSREKIAHIKSIKKNADKSLHVGIHKLPGGDEWVRIDNGLPVKSVPWKSDDAKHSESCTGISPNYEGLEDYECTRPDGYFVCEIPI